MFEISTCQHMPTVIDSPSSMYTAVWAEGEMTSPTVSAATMEIAHTTFHQNPTSARPKARMIAPPGFPSAFSIPTNASAGRSSAVALQFQTYDSKVPDETMSGNIRSNGKISASDLLRRWRNCSGAWFAIRELELVALLRNPESNTRHLLQDL